MTLSGANQVEIDAWKTKMVVMLDNTIEVINNTLRTLLFPFVASFIFVCLASTLQLNKEGKLTANGSSLYYL